MCSTLLYGGLDLTEDEEVAVKDIAPNILEELKGFIVNYDDVEIGDVIGQGGYGAVHKVSMILSDLPPLL